MAELLPFWPHTVSQKKPARVANWSSMRTGRGERGKPHVGFPSLSAGPGDRPEAKIVVPRCFPELFKNWKEKFLLLGFEKTKGFQDFGIKQIWLAVSAVTS